MIFREITNMKKVFNFKLVFTLLLLVMGNPLVCPMHAQEWSNSVRAFTPDSSGVTTVTGTTTAGEIFDAQQASDASQPAGCKARNPDSVLSPCCVKNPSFTNIKGPDCKKATTAGDPTGVLKCETGYLLDSEAGSAANLCLDNCEAAPVESYIILKAEYDNPLKRTLEWFSREGSFDRERGKRIPCQVGAKLPFEANSGAIQKFVKITGCDVLDGNFCQVECRGLTREIVAVFNDPDIKDPIPPRCRKRDEVCSLLGGCCDGSDCQASRLDAHGNFIYECLAPRPLVFNTNTNTTTPTTTSTTGGTKCVTTGFYVDYKGIPCCSGIMCPVTTQCVSNSTNCSVSAGTGGGSGGSGGGTGGGSGGGATCKNTSESNRVGLDCTTLDETGCKGTLSYCIWQ
jgi:hypothetical protein